MDIDREKKEFNVCLLGASLDVGNLGCRALTVSLIKLVHTFLPDAKISLIYANRLADTKKVTVSGEDVIVKVVNYRLTPKARFKDHLYGILMMAFMYRIFPFKSLRNRISKAIPMLNTLEQADFVGDINGGDSFNDDYGARWFILLKSVRFFIIFFMKKKLVMLPQTYGPYKSRITQIIARFIFLQSKVIYSRDKMGIEVVKKLLGKKEKKADIQFCPDVAFSLEAIKPQTIDIIPAIDQKTMKPLIGINVSGLFYDNSYERKVFGLKFDYKEFVQELVKQFLEKTDAHILLVPHNFTSAVESDFKACRDVFDTIKNDSNRIHLVMREYNQNEIKGIIGLCDFFIGTRMHACIAALSQCVPTFSVAYSYKFLGVFKSVNMEDNVIDARENSKDEVLYQCIDHYKNRSHSKQVLLEKIPQIQNELYTCFKNEILNLKHISQ